MFVLITVPHGFCIAKIARTCDLRAESCSKILINILNKKKIKHGKVKMTVPRIDVDFNRMKPKNLKNTKKTKKIHKLPINYKRTKLYIPQEYDTQELQSAEYIKEQNNTQESPTQLPSNNTQESPRSNTNDSPTQLPSNNTQELPLSSSNTNESPSSNTNESPSSNTNESKDISIRQNETYNYNNDVNYYKNDYYHNNTIDNKNKLVSKYWEDFNNKIKKIIKDEKAKKHKILLLDIHSFPKGSFGGAQIAIIDIYNTNREKLDKFAIYIINKMHIDIRIFNGLDNYIQNTYKKSTYPLLLEFCEDRTYLLNETIKLFFEEVLTYFISFAKT